MSEIERSQAAARLHEIAEKIRTGEYRMEREEHFFERGQLVITINLPFELPKRSGEGMGETPEHAHTAKVRLDGPTDPDLRGVVSGSLMADGVPIETPKNQAIDRSDAADAKRLRWILNGQGYFMEEAGLCGHPCDEAEQDDARMRIDAAMD